MKFSEVKIGIQFTSGAFDYIKLNDRFGYCIKTGLLSLFDKDENVEIKMKMLRLSLNARIVSIIEKVLIFMTARLISLMLSLQTMRI